MFRKSGYIKKYEKLRSSKDESVESAAILNDNRDQFNKEDIEKYQQNESKNFFLSHEDEAEKKYYINEVIKTMQLEKVLPPQLVQFESSFKQTSIMKFTSGKAIDYGLDLNTSSEQINQSLGKFYANNDDIGESYLSQFTQKQIENMYAPQNAHLNFFMLLEQEYTFERNLAYTSFIHRETDTSK